MTINYLSPDREALWQPGKTPSSRVLSFMTEKGFVTYEKTFTRLQKQCKPKKKNLFTFQMVFCNFPALLLFTVPPQILAFDQRLQIHMVPPPLSLYSPTLSYSAPERATAFPYSYVGPVFHK